MKEPFKNKDDCNDLDKIFKTPDVTLSKSQVYRKILDNIAAS